MRLQSNIVNSAFGQNNFAKVDVFEFVSFDSRKINKGATTLFFCLSGESRHGNSFVEDAYSKGVRHFIVDENQEYKVFSDAQYLKCANSLDKLQQLAAYYRATLEIPVIAITGSYGKTQVKEWVAELLSIKFETFASPGSYNSQIGVAVSLLNIEDRHEIAIIEAGISTVGEMEKLKKMIAPDLGILTNIGMAHRAGFSSESQHISEKKSLFEDCQYFSTSKYQEKKQFQIEPQFEIAKQYFKTTAQIENLSCALALAQHLEISIEDIIRQLPYLSSFRNRLETRIGEGGNTLLVDCYINDLASLQTSLEEANQESNVRQKIAVLSDFATAEQEDYIKALQLLSLAKFDFLLTVGPLWKQHAHLSPIAIHCFDSKSELLDFLRENPPYKSLLFFKGSRKYALEDIATSLEVLGHETILEIDLEAIRSNIRVLRSFLKPQTKLSLMVKAFGYGSGLLEIAKVAQQANVHSLGVAYVDEGIQLKQSGIRLPIWVINPSKSQLIEAIDAKLEVEISSIEQFKWLCRYLDNSKNSANIHLKIESGMNRLGFQASEIPDLLSTIENHPRIILKSFVSHLANSEFPEKNEEQAKKFIAACSLAPEIDRQLLNSERILTSPQYQFEQVRSGIGIYGYLPSRQGVQFEAALKLLTHISQIKTIQKGEGISYGHTFIADKALKIAVLPIGYADGLPRQLSGKGAKVRIGNKTAEIIGAICMDMCMIDVTDINCTVGEEVVIWQTHKELTVMSDLAGTITYDLLSGVGNRVKRIYLN